MMKTGKLIVEIKYYIEHLIAEGDEMPLEVWLDGIDHNISKSDLEEMSYHAQYLAEYIKSVSI